MFKQVPKHNFFFNFPYLCVYIETRFMQRNKAMQLIDAKLVEATLEGDRNAFNQLIEKHQSFLMGYVLKRVKNLSDAEDILQEAFLRAYQNLSMLQDRSKFASWLYQITKNLCVSWLRRQNRKLKSLDALANTDSHDNSLTPEQILEQKESSECIVRAVEALPERNRKVFILYLEGFSYRDIATSLDIPTSTVLGRLQTAKRRLKDSISEYAPFSVAPGPLRIAMEKLRKDGFTMEEILKHPLRRRIYGISDKYEVRWENDNGESLYPGEVELYLFREVISGRVYPDVFLENGARMHSEDGGYVQYATPECDDILQLIAHEKAGERILERLSLSAEARANRRGFKGRMAVSKLSGETAICTENYLLSKHVKPEQLRNQLIPFLVTRQIFAGAGKAVGLKSDNPYHISRRAD